MQVYARRNLIGPEPPTEEVCLLLEGAWPEDASDAKSAARHSLDELIDAREDWIDEAASRLADDSAVGGDPFYFRNALRLRYAAVKWLRLFAYRRRRRISTAVTLHLSNSLEDREYEALWRAWAASDGFALNVVRRTRVATPSVAPRSSRLRSVLSRCFGNRVRGVPVSRAAGVLLCGSPRILGPVADRLLEERVPFAWLFDAFAVRPWLRWGRHGVPLFTCDASPTEDSKLVAARLPTIRFDEVDLSPVVEAWRAGWEPRVGVEQARQVRRIEAHLATFRPAHVVVDEDATPLKRIVVDAARRRGAATCVLQHGACGVRFGFAPLLADRIYALDEGARRQLRAWGLSERQIVCSPPAERSSVVRTPSPKPKRIRKFLLLGTTPPRDERPDAVTFHLTGRTYDAMLTDAFAVLAERGDADLVVRAHPRAADDPILRQVCERRPDLPVRIARPDDSLAAQIAAADCVLSCASSAGLEAARLGRPVIQLLPSGSGAVLPAAWYGLVGDARSAEELRTLLLQAETRRPKSMPFADASLLARRIVDDILRGRFNRSERNVVAHPIREVTGA